MLDKGIEFAEAARIKQNIQTLIGGMPPLGAMCFDALFAAAVMARRTASMKFINFCIHHSFPSLNREYANTASNSPHQSHSAVHSTTAHDPGHNRPEPIRAL